MKSLYSNPLYSRLDMIRFKNNLLIEKEYDAFGNLIYTKGPHAEKGQFEEWITYDAKGNIVKYKNSLGHKELYIYSSEGYIVNCQIFDDYLTVYEFDSNGNVTHSKEFVGFEFEGFYEYDQDENLIHTSYTNGYEIRYDSEGNVIYEKYVNGDMYFYNSQKECIRKNITVRRKTYYNGTITKMEEF